jgi:hypothetical protein
MENDQETREKSDRKCLESGHPLASNWERHQGWVLLLDVLSGIFLSLLSSPKRFLLLLSLQAATPVGWYQVVYLFTQDL